MKPRKAAALSRWEVKTTDLRWECDPKRLDFETTEELQYRPNIIGQERALDAMRLGLTIRSPGYNIYISGLSGTGKLTAIRYMLDGMDLRRSDLVDICYVFNFSDEDQPTCLMLPAGRACKLRQQLHSLRDTISDFIPAALRSDQFKHRQAAIADDVRKHRDKMLRVLEKEVSESGFSVVQVEYEGYARPEIVPLIRGESIPMDRLAGLLAQGKMGQGDYDKLQAAYPGLSRKLDDFLLSSRELERDLDHRTADLEREFIGPFVAERMAGVSGDLESEKVLKFLKELEEYILSHLPIFISGKADGFVQREFLPFEVNVLVDNSGEKEAPVIIETSPSYVNVFGTIERHHGPDGQQSTDHSLIRGGSLLRSNGGFLVMNLIDVFEEPLVWVALKRALKSQRHTIRGFDSLLLMPIASIKPEEIVIDAKVVLIGDAWSYQMLWEYDEDFRGIFKVKADFDSEMPNTLANQKKYGQFIKVLTRLESLAPFRKDAVAAMIEVGVRMAGRRNRLSTRFSEVGDIVREAVHWAGADGAAVVRAEHVLRAVEERKSRVSLAEDKLQELYSDGRILLDTSGLEVGQINGLAVYDMGDHVFGRPSRITVETGVGRAGVINIEREAEMSGRIHNKGMLILEGYLRRMYAQDKPITVSASICFEQGYSSVDGDSASSAEMYALLSSLADIPLRQDIAVTGSMNQKGEVQPIGGVNEKIEGFFDVCRQRGLKGHHGVMIPSLNVPELMLRKDVAEAVAKGRFHIYAVSTLDEGIEVLTGMKAGRRLRNGQFPRGTVHFHVNEGLWHFHDELRHAEDGHAEPPEKPERKHASRERQRPPRPTRRKKPDGEAARAAARSRPGRRR
ncbi:MAG TPA: ATP-binding protein [Candidatus Krumholzibacteria bacterium]|nr:ATP-binding protein [Candidatus Krumholzibacteria bacterium]